MAVRVLVIIVTLCSAACAGGLRLPPDPEKKVTSKRGFSPSEELPAKFNAMHGDELMAQLAETESFGSPDLYGPQGNNATIDPGAPIKLVIGVPSPDMQDLHAVRAAHRKTWMSHPGVCELKDYGRDDCKVFPLFLQSAEGSLHDEAVSFQHTIPNISEVNNSGYEVRQAGVEDEKNGRGGHGDQRNNDDCSARIFALFKYAYDNLPWATHVAKLDMDAYPHIPKILRDLSGSPRENLYFGFSSTRKRRSRDYCSLFIEGSFMGISSDQLGCVVDGWPKHARQGHHGGRADNDDNKLLFAVQAGCNEARAPWGSGRAMHDKVTCLDVRSNGLTHPV